MLNSLVLHSVVCGGLGPETRTVGSRPVHQMKWAHAECLRRKTFVFSLHSRLHSVCVYVHIQYVCLYAYTDISMLADHTAAPIRSTLWDCGDVLFRLFKGSAGDGRWERALTVNAVMHHIITQWEPAGLMVELDGFYKLRVGTLLFRWETISGHQSLKRSIRERSTARFFTFRLNTRLKLFLASCWLQFDLLLSSCHKCPLRSHDSVIQIHLEYSFFRYDLMKVFSWICLINIPPL